MTEALQNPSAQTLISYYPDSEHGDSPQRDDKAWSPYSSSQLQAFHHTCRGQWHYQSTQLWNNNLAQGSLRYHSRAVMFCWAKAKQEHISNNVQEVQSTCLAQLSQGSRAMAPVCPDLSTTSDWPCQAALCPREHPLPHHPAQTSPPYLINPRFSVSCTRNLRDGQFHCVKLANNWIKVQ